MIDICWDLVVGRGGQALLIWICYPLFRRSLSRVMETNGVSFQVFAAISFDQISVSSVAKLTTATVGAITGRRQVNSHAKRTSSWHFLCLILTSAYLLSYPTFLSSITGYQTLLSPYAWVTPLRTGLVPTSGWSTPMYVLLDGSRIGLQDYFPIYMYDDSGTYDSIEAGAANYSKLYSTLISCYLQPELLSNTTAQQAQEYFARGEDFVFSPSNACSFTLPPNATSLVQSISSSVTLSGEVYNISSPTLSIVGNAKTTQDSDAEYFAFGNVTFTSMYLKRYSMCVPDTTYQWGFASIPSFILCLLTIVFAAMLVALQQDAFLNGRIDRYEEFRRTNVFRDVLDLADGLKDTFRYIQSKSAREVKELVDGSSSVMMLETGGLLHSRKEARREAKLRHAPPMQQSTRWQPTLPVSRWRRSTSDSESSAEKGYITVDEVEL
ncbi:hypothetical protein LTR86_005913 [Recurvomyces mirabilis]|nr:hypothetical protein LTR86_005913 [Recurvomyces mirabilis]